MCVRVCVCVVCVATKKRSDRKCVKVCVYERAGAAAGAAAAAAAAAAVAAVAAEDVYMCSSEMAKMNSR